MQSQNHSRLTFRLAQSSDCRAIFEWRSLPDTIQVSKSQTSISWNDHQAWFEQLLKEQPKRQLWMAALKDHQPEELVGWVRAEPVDNGFELSWLIDAKFRGQGLGSEMLSWATQELSPHSCRAWILATNEASKKMASNCGYKIVKEEGNVQLWRVR